MTEKVSMMSAQKLAFLGDAVYELLIREKIVNSVDGSIGKLHNLKVSKVCCEAQSEMLSKIESILTDEELAVYKRGRNVQTGRVPKNSVPGVYRRATGLEALFGYLYLTGNMKRAYEFLKIMDV